MESALASCRIYTPASLANAMVSALGDSPRISWLEPSHGKGAFVEAIALLGVPRGRIVAVDIDRAPASADNRATTFRGVDFLQWARTTDRRFDRIVGNPPYVAIRRLPLRLKKRAASILDIDNEPIGLRANLWYAFVLASIRLLRKGGSLAFILPSAAEFANYSAAMRVVGAKYFGSLEVFRCGQPLFEDVNEGTVVAIAREFGNERCLVRRRRFTTRGELVAALSESGRVKGRACPAGIVRDGTSMEELGSIASIRVGGVTGNASYFLLTEAKRRALSLPMSAVNPVVSKAHHLRSAHLLKVNWKKLLSAGERVWLFNPTGRAMTIPSVRRYLTRGVSNGGCDRDAYKISSRTPWYRTPMPACPHAFISGMSQYGPWLCINGMKGLNATNTLYVVNFRSNRRADWYRWALALLTTTVQRQCRRIGRQYADGLIKFEPRSLSGLRLPKLSRDVDYCGLHKSAVRALLAGDRVTARRIADSAI